MRIKIPYDALVVMIGAMGTGKSTLCSRMFHPHDIVETDFIRKQLSGDHRDQSQNRATFEILFATVEARAKAGILTVVDSTGNGGVIENVRAIGQKYKRPLVSIQVRHLKPEEITPERMKHRWNHLSIYNRHVARIDRTIIPKAYTHYYVEDLDAVQIEHEQAVDKISLDPQFNYVIVPDLHGEFRALEENIKMHANSPLTKYIFLGDLVDRGESSYKTFQIVNSLLKEKKGFCVISNHDNKFYRWIKKWKKDSMDTKFDMWSDIQELPAYQMTLSSGLSNTVREFLQILPVTRLEYADAFVEYYESLPSYLTLERKDTIHYFTHAGISYNIAAGKREIKSDKEWFLYHSLQTAEEVQERFQLLDTTKNIVLHVGHNYAHDEITTLTVGRFAMVRHDIGLGKRVINFTPIFMEV